MKARARTAIPAIGYDAAHGRLVTMLAVVDDDGRVYLSVSVDGPGELIEIPLPERKPRNARKARPR